MTREIKFRGKRTDNNEWIYGYYYKGKRQDTDVPLGDIRIFDCILTPDGLIYDVIGNTVGQWTGEYDSNEVDIYEKDIWTDGRKNYKFVITDLEQYYWAKFDDQMHHNFESGHVMGNVIDNPELVGE